MTVRRAPTPFFPWPLPATAGAGLFLLTATLGCSQQVPTRAVDLTVVDAQGTPLVGATVRADATSPRHPLDFLGALAAEPRPLGVWTTNQQGRCTIFAAADHRPTTVMVVAPGFAPWLWTADVGKNPDLVARLEPVAGPPATAR